MLLDPGIYQLNCMTEPVMSTTKNGFTQIEYEFTVLEGPEQKIEFGAGGKSPVGRTVKDWIVVIPTTPDKKGTEWKLKSLLVAMGIITRDDKTSAIARGQFGTSVFVGGKFLCRVVADMWEGKEKRKLEYMA